MSLCLDSGCAFCCDGTLFNHGEFKKEELPFLDKRLAIEQSPASNPDEPTEYHFILPCKMCRNDSCSIYVQGRPKACGEYQCKLLIDHQQGKVSTEDAQTLVKEVKSLRNRLRPQMEEFTGSENNLSFKHLLGLTLKKLEKTEAVQQQPDHREMSLNILLFCILIAKNFESSFTTSTYNSNNDLTKP